MASADWGAGIVFGILLRMDKKKIIYSIVAVLVILFGWFFFFRTTKDSLRIVVKNYSEKTSLYETHIEYPQFPDLSKTFNKKIQTTILDAEAKFKKSSEENEKARKDTGGRATASGEYSFAVSWVPDQLNSNTVSFVVRVSYYTGGAHGGEDVFTFNYNILKKKEVALSELFLTTPDYLDRISQFAINELKLQMKQTSGVDPNMDMLIAGASPKVENFSRFTLGAGDTITFYFPQYQVAPYVFGEQKVLMPLSYLIQKKTQ